jgi:OPT oligopeptide transporter protein
MVAGVAAVNAGVQPTSRQRSHLFWASCKLDPASSPRRSRRSRNPTKCPLGSENAQPRTVFSLSMFRMSRRLSEDADRIIDIELEHSISSSTEAVDDESAPSEDEDVGVEESAESIDTPRMWTLSILFAILGSSFNLFFSLRYPSISISPILALLLSHPLGLFWDAALKEPERGVQRDDTNEEDSPLLTPTDSPGGRRSSSRTGPSYWRRIKRWLAQGEWNQKEHCCVFIASSVSFGFAFATDVCWSFDDK